MEISVVPGSFHGAAKCSDLPRIARNVQDGF